MMRRSEVQPYNAESERAFMNRAKNVKNIGHWNLTNVLNLKEGSYYDRRLYIDAIIGAAEDAAIAEYGEESELYYQHLDLQAETIEYLFTNNASQQAAIDGLMRGVRTRKDAKSVLLSVATNGAQYVRDTLSPGSEEEKRSQNSAPKRIDTYDRLMGDLKRSGGIDSEKAEHLRIFFGERKIDEQNGELARIQHEMRQLAEDLMARISILGGAEGLSANVQAGIACIKRMAGPSQAGVWTPDAKAQLAVIICENPKYNHVSRTEIKKNINLSIIAALRELYSPRQTRIVESDGSRRHNYAS